MKEAGDVPASFLFYAEGARCVFAHEQSCKEKVGDSDEDFGGAKVHCVHRNEDQDDAEKPHKHAEKVIDIGLHHEITVVRLQQVI